MRMCLIAAVILLLDQFLKQLVLKVFDLPLWFVSGDIGLELSYNSGVAFSLPIRGVLAIILSSAIILFFVGLFIRQSNNSYLSDVCFGLIIGGAIGNLLDRIFLGAVVDYIRIYSYPTFNLADVAITVGILLFGFAFDRITSKRFSLF